MLEVLARLFHLCGDNAYQEKSQALIQAIAPQDRRALMNQPSLALGFEILDQALQIIVVSPDKGDAGAAALLSAALKSSPSHTIVAEIDAEATLQDRHPAAGKSLVEGRAAAYVCRGPVCERPVTSPEDLVAALTVNG